MRILPLLLILALPSCRQEEDLVAKYSEAAEKAVVGAKPHSGHEPPEGDELPDQMEETWQSMDELQKMMDETKEILEDPSIRIDSESLRDLIQRLEN